MLRGMWDLPRPGLEPVSPALAGGFLTTAPPGKSLKPYAFEVKRTHGTSVLYNFIYIVETIFPENKSNIYRNFGTYK